MKILFIGLLLTLLLPFISCAHDFVKLRELFYSACVSEKAATEMLHELEKVNDKSAPLLLGYKGMAYMFLSKFAFFPTNKLSYFIKGKDLIESAIKNDSENIELRYFRFSVQTNAPFFLNYHSKIEDDKKSILKNICYFEDEKFKTHIISAMLSCYKCSDAEKLLLASE